MRNAAFVALFTLSAWGCTLTDAQAGPEGDTSPETAVDLGNAAVWIGATTSGLEVTVRPDRVPVTVGVTMFQISFEQGASDDIPVSIDVVSPEMPAMGIMRYAAEPSGPNTYTSSAEISMEGAWEIYVNLGDGTDSAPFAFDVQPGDMDGSDPMAGHDHTLADTDMPAAPVIEDPEAENHASHQHDMND